MLKRSKGEKVFGVFNTFLMLLIMLMTLYPCLYVLFASVSDPIALYNGSKVLVWPRGLTFSNYKYVFENPMIWTGYMNTIFYAVAGTSLSVLLTVLAAYSLSQENLPGKNIFLMGMIFTMYFAGGMIPTFLVVKAMGIVNTRLAMIIPGAISTYNFIIVLSYFRSMPASIEEAATIDGANEFTVLFKILVPLAKPVISVIALYYLVGIWNNYFSGLMYIYDRDKYPLQLVLREILFQGTMDQTNANAVNADDSVRETIKYAVMIVSIIPVLCVYPFIQRYFVKGVMIGAVKG